MTMKPLVDKFWQALLVGLAVITAGLILWMIGTAIIDGAAIIATHWGIALLVVGYVLAFVACTAALGFACMGVFWLWQRRSRLAPLSRKETKG